MHHVVVCVHVQQNSQVVGTDAQAFVACFLHLLLANRFHRNTSWGHIVRDQDGKCLFAASLLIIDPNEHGVLIVIGMRTNQR